MHEVFKEFVFHAAHLLPNVPDDHPCKRLHGHEYRVTVAAVGKVSEPSGWVIDYADIASAWRPLHEQVDHRFLNEIPGLENSTSENLARWIWDKLAPVLPVLSKVTVWETCSAGCSYTGRTMKTPKQILPHENEYKPDAWKDYSPEELAWWVRLLTKRAEMRTEPAKAEKDRADAANYQAMLDAMEE